MKGLVGLLSVLIFSVGLLYFINNDFWQDEVYTIFHFVFVPVKTTLIDYHTTNNHVLFSLILNLYTSILKFQRINVLNSPWIFRVISLLISLVNVYVLFVLSKKRYGKNAALLIISYWTTTICIADFAMQLRGYSLSMLITTVQYFLFLDIVYSKFIRVKQILLLFLLCISELLIMPTNIYINLSYLLFCFIGIIKPSLAGFFFNEVLPRKKIVLAGLPILIATILGSLYYYILLHANQPIDFLNKYLPFNVFNLVQSIAIFYHFVSLRYYVYIFLVIAIIYAFKKSGRQYFIDFLWPMFLFFMPFAFFFIHGAIIIQRTFLSLMPFFICMVSLITAEIDNRFQKLRIGLVVMVLNIFCFIYSFLNLITVSKMNNENSIHKQDLTAHYYLINFNAKQTVFKLQELMAEKRYPVYLCDDFGQTGLGYYLQEFKIPFTRCSDSLNLPSHCYIIANNKEEISKKLIQGHFVFERILDSDKQYNIFLVNNSSSYRANDKG